MSTVTKPQPVVDPWEKRPVVGKFKVLSGVHSEGSVPGTYRIDPAGTPMFEPRVYRTGEIVASRSDLLKHNPIHGEGKFEQVNDETPDKYAAEESVAAKEAADAGPVDLEDMTIGQLRKLAASEGIDLGDFTRKQDIIAWIRESRGESQ